MPTLDPKSPYSYRLIPLFSSTENPQKSNLHLLSPVRLLPVPPKTLQHGFYLHHSMEIAVVKVMTSTLLNPVVTSQASFLICQQHWLFSFLNSFFSGLSGKQHLMFFFLLFCLICSQSSLPDSFLSSPLVLESPGLSPQLSCLSSHPSLSDLIQSWGLKCSQYPAQSQISLSSLDLWLDIYTIYVFHIIT